MKKDDSLQNTRATIITRIKKNCDDQNSKNGDR